MITKKRAQQIIKDRHIILYNETLRKIENDIRLAAEDLLTSTEVTFKSVFLNDIEKLLLDQGFSIESKDFSLPNIVILLITWR